ncbi:putative DNA-binding transcriptional regulator YafY [Paenibacillus cellulosilyticus]|uniref:Putative DNA-binding transcriptional regulator YafY n=1 Tax=Paenibacillus cellulosilyticus TaxID=375489 RepID=A0A2V2YU22_9BACL|nr:YafY family protein [Paenibacillus cellulosilyticus]PWW02436.1 putative DNA-binding transcriptional regulator YafY [Paenibacillus cellulosilyticus]QKS47147.1 YafY family transcriptional regulator [Paenibacillus cellulosilyticus]
MKLERLMTITILLLNRKRVQAQELADQLEVSLRTIYRDLDSLGQAGIPIVSYTGMEGGYEIMDSFRLDRQLLSFDELTALSTALRGLESTKAYDSSNMDLLLSKVGAMVAQAEQGRAGEGHRIHVDFTPWKNSEEDQTRYDALRQAVNEHKLIRFNYTSRTGDEQEREVEPMALVLKNYAWYLHGYCRLRDDYRIFKLTRIRELNIRSETFIRRAESLAQLNDRWMTPERNEEFSVVLRFKASAAVNVMDHFDHKDIERLPDGQLIVRTTYSSERWLIRMVLHYMADVMVLEPADLAAKVKTTALDIARQYGGLDTE